MRLLRLLIFASIGALALFASGPVKTVGLHKLGTLEPVVRATLERHEFAVLPVEQAADADLLVSLERKDLPEAARNLLYKQTGRRDDSVLKATERKTGKVVLSQSFDSSGGEQAATGAVEAFARRLRGKL
jgi:hypothetical protein